MYDCKCPACGLQWANRFPKRPWFDLCPHCGNSDWLPIVPPLVVVKAACDMSTAALESGASEEEIKR